MPNGHPLSGFCILARRVRIPARGGSMPAKKRRVRTASPSARAPRGRRGSSSKRAPRTKGFRCPDCDFVAKHAMGLGRHRSARHGVMSLRQRRRESSGAWLTRREAARRAGVHYNTIRHWERTGRLRRQKGAGSRGALVSAIDLDSMSGRGGRGGPGVADDARLQTLERRFNDLLDGLERLVSGSRPARRSRRGRPPAGARRS